MKELLMTYWAEIALAILTAAGTITALTETEIKDHKRGSIRPHEATR